MTRAFLVLQLQRFERQAQQSSKDRVIIYQKAGETEEPADKCVFPNTDSCRTPLLPCASQTSIAVVSTQSLPRMLSSQDKHTSSPATQSMYSHLVLPSVGQRKSKQRPKTVLKLPKVSMASCLRSSKVILPGK